MRNTIFELCAETIDACIAAKEGGAHRIKLCSGLSEEDLLRVMDWCVQSSSTAVFRFMCCFVHVSADFSIPSLKLKRLLYQTAGAGGL